MPPMTVRTVRITDEDWEALDAVHARDGILVSEQVRRAVKAWLESKGVQPKAPAASRRKP